MLDIYVVFLLVPLNADKETFEKTQIEKVQNILGEEYPREKVMSLIGAFPENEAYGYPCGGVSKGTNLLSLLDTEAMLRALPQELKLLQEDLEIMSIMQIDTDEYIVIIQQAEYEIYFKVIFSDSIKINKYIVTEFQYVCMTESGPNNIAKEILANC